MRIHELIHPTRASGLYACVRRREGRKSWTAGGRTSSITMRGFLRLVLRWNILVGAPLSFARPARLRRRWRREPAVLMIFGAEPFSPGRQRASEQRYTAASLPLIHPRRATRATPLPPLLLLLIISIRTHCLAYRTIANYGARDSFEFHSIPDLAMLYCILESFRSRLISN